MKKEKIFLTKFKGLFKGQAIAIIFTIISILIFAFILKMIGGSDKVIPFFNQALKIIGIIIASYFSGGKERNHIISTFGGVMFILITFLLFSIIGGQFGSVIGLFADIGMGGIIGFIVSLLLKQKNKA